MVLVTGSLAFDLIMDFPGKFADHINPDKLHIINLSFLVNNLKKEKGGTAGNIAYNFGLLGQPVGVLAVAGADFTEYKKFLDKFGVDTSGIKILKDDLTSQAFIMNDLKDNQITSFYPGAMKKASTLKITNGRKRAIDIAIIAPNDPQAMNNLCLECKRLVIPYMYDPGMQLPRLSDKQLMLGIENARILIGNDYEVSLIKKRLKVTGDGLLNHCQILITTLGEKGSLVKTKENEIKIKAGKAKRVVDPTGAGDAYRAGFLRGYLNGLDLKTSGQMGSITACYAIEKYGTTNHTFTMEEYKKRYEENYREELKL